MGAPKRKAGGFTLVELMITVAIVAILAAIAIPSYRQYLIRGHRSAAKAEMMNIANKEQQFLVANRVYADKAGLEAGGYVPPDEVTDYYTWDVVPNDPGDPPYFLITMTPTGTQAVDGALTLDSQGTRTPLEKWQK